MANSQQYQPPKRKEPGLIGRLLSGTTQLIAWLIISLIFSIFIEWMGMVYFWPDQRDSHAKEILQADQAYLNQHLQWQSATYKHLIAERAEQVVRWIDKQVGLVGINHRPTIESGRFFSAITSWASGLYNRYDRYILAAGYVSQTFVIRLTLILFSLPVFALTGLVGAIDGLVERDLRRWGGGRESSNVFNLAKRSIMPAFVMACVIYIGLPYSLNPSFIILPFACLYGLAVRVAFERLKKYF
jgi:integrating conjugative element membrane protein (TIGR03747 family)